jgi:hypothetical protein
METLKLSLSASRCMTSAYSPGSSKRRPLRRGGLALAWAVAFAIRAVAAQEEGEDDAIVAIAQLRDHPGLLDEAILKQHIAETFKLEPADEPAQGRFFVSGTEEDFVVAIDGVIFMVLDFSDPYFTDPESEIQAAKDPRLKDAIRRNKAWLSVDLMQDKDDPDAVAAGYRTIGKLQASLIDENTLALHDARARVSVAWNREYAPLLLSPKPLVVFATGLLDFEADEVRRKEWAAFLTAYATATDTQRFYVQAMITENPSKDPEARWLRIHRLGAGSFDAVTIAEPVDWTNPHEQGDPRKLDQGSVIDWNILETPGDADAPQSADE